MHPYALLGISLIMVLQVLGCVQNDAGSAAEAPQDGDKRQEAAESQATLIGVRWILTEIGGEAVDGNSGQAELPYLMFESEEGVSGFAGCNQMSGGYEREGENGLRFSRLVTTRMACPDMQIEQRFLSALDAVRSYAILSDVLSLADADGKVVMALKREG